MVTDASGGIRDWLPGLNRLLVFKQQHTVAFERRMNASGASVACLLKMLIMLNVQVAG